VFDGHVGESDGRRDGNASLRYWVAVSESRGQRTLAVVGWEHDVYRSSSGMNGDDWMKFCATMLSANRHDESSVWLFLAFARAPG
jgi:hypothetical protein